MSREEMKKQDFNGLGITPGLLKRIASLGFKHPTPIQFKAIPIATSGEDVVGIAQTGSGKTLAFSVPMLQHVQKTGQIGLVLLPTRELAVQVDETLNKLAGSAGLKTAIIIGGTSSGKQIKQLKARPHVIVATPGRLIDLVEQKIAKLGNVGVLILDEADRMLDMGFAPQLKKILSFIPKDRQTMLFSATMPAEISEIAKQYMRTPLRVEVARPGTAVDTIDQEVFIVPRGDKLSLLMKLLKEYKGTILVFSRTKYGAKKIARKIRQAGHRADELHSNRSQAQRQKALKGFTNGTFRILVATDIAARGIDVDNIELVVNFDLPDQVDDYVHRIGRTGRAGRSGKAISFAAPEQKADVAQIQKLINAVLPIKSPSGEDLPTISKAAHGAPRKKKSSGGSRGRGGRKGGGGRNPYQKKRNEAKKGSSGRGRGERKRGQGRPRRSSERKNS